MDNSTEQALKDALNGNINAFQSLFVTFQAQLKSYLYRLTASRDDADDLAHDTFIRAYDKLNLFRGESSLKTWVFQIATNLAYNHMQRQKRWTPDVLEQSKALVLQHPDMAGEIERVVAMGKTLPIENQIALILKEVYDFSLKEICVILEKSEGVVKYLLQSARQTMTDIFNARCALINKEGVCHQCSELNGWFNPKQDQQAALMEIELVRGSKKYNREDLFTLRTTLIKQIDPLRSGGNELQEFQGRDR